MTEIRLRKLIRVDENQEVTSLEFQTCHFANLYPNFTNSLSKLKFLRIENGRVDEFQEQSLNVKNIVLKEIRPLNLNKATSKIFGDAVEYLLLENVELIDFSSSAFLGMKNESQVIIADSVIKPHDDTHVNEQFLQMILFRNVEFFRSYTPFLNINAANMIKFLTCKMDLNAENSLTLISDQILFQNSTLLLNSPEPMRVTAANFEMIGCTLDQPQLKSFMGLTPMNTETSTLKFTNITMTDPAKGTFLTKFINVDFENISLEDGCYCQTVMHLACATPSDLGYRTSNLLPTLTCDDLTSLLMNQTFCKSRSNEYLPVTSEEVCPKIASLKAENIAMVSVLCGILFVVIIISVGFCYSRYLKSKEKDKVIRKWRMAYPATTVYRYPKRLSFLRSDKSTIFILFLGALN